MAVSQEGAAEEQAGLTRRRMLRLAALAGGSALGVGLAGCDSSRSTPRTPVAEAAPSLVVPPPGPVANPATGINLFTQDDLNFEALFALGEVGYGAGETGEIVATANQINAAGASYQSFYDGFVAMAQQVGGIGDQALKAGHWASARSAYLRSAQYFNEALYFVLGTSTPNNEAAVYADMQRQWDLAAQLFDPAFERVSIPYQHTTLPGYFLKPDSSNTRRPTVIVNNGSDAQFIDVYAFGGAASIERGYNALLFEGPGQGSVLFERQIPFRPDWEQVITPIVDYLHTRSDVDTGRIALTGWSFAGELVIRAAAFEGRLAAICADPGVADYWLSFPPSIRNLFANGATAEQVNGIWQSHIIPTFNAQSRFTLSKRSEIFGPQFLAQARSGQVFTDLFALGQAAMQYQNTDVAGRITKPVLVTNYELEQFFPGQAQQLYDLLRSNKQLVTFTAAEGAEYHDAPMAPQRRNQVIFDWLDGTLHLSRGPR
jgi:hypothetical protein